MIDDAPQMTVVRVGGGTDDWPPALDDDLAALAVETPADLFEALEERRAGCVVLAPDDRPWDPTDVLADLQDRAVDAADGSATTVAAVPVVVETADDLSAYVDADVLSAVAGVVRPGDTAALAAQVERAVDTYREREAARQARDRYRTLLAESPAPIALLDDEGQIRFANDAVATLLEVDDPEDLTGRDALSFVAPEEYDVAEKWFGRVIGGEEATPAAQRTLVDATGQRKYVVASMQRVVVDGRAAVQVLLSDVTEHKRLETRLRAERDRLSTLFENLNEPVVETRFEDGQPVVTAVNDAFVDTFGVDRETAVGEALDVLIVPADERDEAAAINDRARAGEHLELEVTRRTPDGERDFLLRFAPFEHGGESDGEGDGGTGEGDGGTGEDAGTEADGEGGSGAGGYAIYVDITERSEWERQLRRQNERLEEVAAVVSHDLRNPLNVARGTVEVLADDADESERDLFERVQRAHDRMEAIIEDMLALARQGQSVAEMEPVDLARVARAAWGTTDTADATLDVETTATVCADGSRLQGAFENLFGNAVEHAGSDVTVRVGDLAAAEDRPGGFFVEDDGPGIPEVEREDVFESGFSSAEGTGFGLAIVRSIVEAHGWDVRITDGTDGGARFEITGVEFAD